MPLPRLVITRASGFVGRYLLDALNGKNKIFANARRSQKQSGAPIHPNILWHRADIGDYDALAAVFSDWCEYPVLYMFLGTWLSDTWTSNVLAGRGKSSVPYLHIRDVVSFFKALLDRIDQLEHGEILMASTDGSITHRELFDEVTLAYFGQRKNPIFMPKLLCPVGVHMRRFFGNFTGSRPFESPWMCRYIDRQMNMDGSKTRARLGWNPRPRLEILRRIPFIVENYRAEPAEWHHRNTAAMKVAPLLLHLKIHSLMKAHGI
ncbi:MAG: hypothetical protein NTY09_10155 [bacterium]|nr:hypothetical protein [bacterium]